MTVPDAASIAITIEDQLTLLWLIHTVASVAAMASQVKHSISDGGDTYRSTLNASGGTDDTNIEPSDVEVPLATVHCRFLSNFNCRIPLTRVLNYPIARISPDPTHFSLIRSSSIRLYVQCLSVRNGTRHNRSVFDYLLCLVAVVDGF